MLCPVGGLEDHFDLTDASVGDCWIRLAIRKRWPLLVALADEDPALLHLFADLVWQLPGQRGPGRRAVTPSNNAGIRQSRSCGLKQLERALRVAGVVAVGGGDAGVAVQAQQADGQAAHSLTPSRGRASSPDQ